MSRIDRSPQAEQDLDEIWFHIAQDDLRAADRVLDRIHAKLRDYAENPGMGRPHFDLMPGLRGFPVGSYLVF